MTHRLPPNYIMRWIILTLLLATSANADTCPPAPDHSAQMTKLIAQIQTAKDHTTARAITSQMWQLWRDAPDARAQSLLDRGIARREASDYTAAYAALDELVKYCPAYAEGHNQRAFVQFLRTDYASAIEDLDRALELSPSHFGAMSGKALSLIRLGRMDAAQIVLREAVSLNPWLAERAFLIEPPGEEI